MSGERIYPPPPPCGGCPHVAMGIATLIGHRMTSSHSSKGPLRPPVSEGQFRMSGEGLAKNVDLRSLMSLRITLTGFHALCAQLFSIIGFIPLPLYGTLRRSGCFAKPLYKNWQ